MTQLESLRYLPLSWLIVNLTSNTVCQQQILSGKVLTMNKLAIHKHAVISGDVLTRNQILVRIVQAESKGI